MLFYTKIDSSKELLVNGMRKLSMGKLYNEVNLINLKYLKISKNKTIYWTFYRCLVQTLKLVCLNVFILFYFTTKI